MDEPAGGPVVEPNYGINVISRVIWFVGGIILLLLAFRFALSLLGANTTNGFAQFIYNTSHPFVAPFFNLFSYNNIQYGVSRFEVYTLVAMAVYAAVAWVLSALANIGRRYY
ncbi:YggT family protein [Candidatus Saccharibacteria bacterium]|nr:YggT family protein [Candidatus Saccharibacteria bacterium]